MDNADVKRIVEAALLAAGQPLGLAALSALFPEDAPAPPGSIERALTELREPDQARGIELVEVASGFRFQIKTELQPWVSRLWTERQTRYSRALLETLALIAYRQPITRGEIEQIRGVAVSSNIIRTLEERDWVRVVGHRDVPGRPALYGTTRGFLDYFNLKSLDQLPPLAELREIPELEPELGFDAAVAAPTPAQLEQDGDSPTPQGEAAAGGHEAGDAADADVDSPDADADADVKADAADTHHDAAAGISDDTNADPDRTATAGHGADAGDLPDDSAEDALREPTR